MSAAELLTIAAMEGVRLVLTDNRLTWEADHQPPADLLASIKAHKLELIETLKAANDPAKDDPVLGNAAIDQSQVVDGPQYIIHTAATASPEWRNARDDYHNHIFGCLTCYGPSGRYCANGAVLRQRYDMATE